MEKHTDETRELQNRLNHFIKHSQICANKIDKLEKELKFFKEHKRQSDNIIIETQNKLDSI